MKHWFAAILAALIVVVAGSALASVPGGGTNFVAQDPAVTAIASGQTPATGGGAEACHWKAEEMVYCQGEGITFTPASDATCLVGASIGLVGEPMGEKAGLLDGVEYGIGLHYEGADHQVDQNGLAATPSYQSYATMPRTRLVPVEAGKEYSLEVWIHSTAASHGTAYWYLSYVCFG